MMHDQGSRERVEALLAEMTLREKIGQMTQAEKNSVTPEAVATHALGSVLSGGGGNPTPNTVEGWAAMVRAFQEGALRSRLGIPLLYGVDAVHGHNNLHGATIVPHNIGLGAARNPALVARAARVTAREMLATNVHWDFAPMVAVPQDIRWGRTYEGFSEQTELVAEMGVAFLRGLQGDVLSPSADGEAGLLPLPQPVLGSVKHFVGDGGTGWGTTSRQAWMPHVWQTNGETWQLDQGDTAVDEATLRAVHLAPYQAAIAAGARNIMVSYSSWQGSKMHGHHWLLTEVLKGELGFEGFLVSDWMGINQLAPDYETAVVRSIVAGLDMIMVPFEYERFIQVLESAVERGDVPLSRIDDAVRRILRVKAEMGLFERPFGDPDLVPEVGGAAHREIAREAVRASLVLLKHEGGVLPLDPALPRLLVAGQAADDIGAQCGGWTIEWQGALGPITPGTTVLEGLRSLFPGEIEYLPDGVREGEAPRAPVGLVFLHEQPYAEGDGDRVALALPPEAHALVARVRPLCERLVVVLFSGRPLLINEILDQSDAFVAAWLPGTEGQGVADVLCGAAPFGGTLTYTWPRTPEQVAKQEAGDPLFPVGHGLRV